MEHYQIIEQTKRIIDRISFGIDLLEHHEIVYYTVKMLLSYPLQDRKEIYKELIHTFATDEEWYQVIETLQFFPYYENVILETRKPYTTTAG